jgi:dTDP-4-dehydrorhamnose reductase
LTALTKEQFDVSNGNAVSRTVATGRYDVILNAAAYTAVDKAEFESQRAAAINVDGPRFLAQAARRLAGCRLIHISTDYVFDGQSTSPYKADDEPSPVNVYGWTKLEGEHAARSELGERAVVLRTAWVYSESGRNFLLTMLRLMRERGAVRVVTDQRGSPTCAASIARAVWRIVALPDLSGVLHWTDEGIVSWYEFACAIADDALAAGALAPPIQVAPITTAEYPTAARRPPNSVLDTREAAKKLSMTPVPWRTALRETLRQVR